MAKIKKSSIVLTCLLLLILVGVLFLIDGNASNYIIRITRLSEHDRSKCRSILLGFGATDRTNHDSIGSDKQLVLGKGPVEAVGLANAHIERHLMRINASLGTFHEIVPCIYDKVYISTCEQLPPARRIARQNNLVFHQ